MKYCLVGLASALSLSMGFMSINNSINITEKSFGDKLNIEQSHNAELHAIGCHPIYNPQACKFGN
ncbi:hypothetical protein [Acaryochloris marina]|nr:hypothetical protein [Acaryochloris marina]